MVLKDGGWGDDGPPEDKYHFLTQLLAGYDATMTVHRMQVDQEGLSVSVLDPSEKGTEAHQVLGDVLHEVSE